MPVRCDDVAPRLAAAAGDLAVLRAADRRHVESCLRCQAEVVYERRLLRALHDLRSELLEPAPGLLTDVLDAIELAGDEPVSRPVRDPMRNSRRVVSVGGAIVLAGGAIVLAGRARRRLPLAG
jgi:hypothetical protein